MTIGCFFKGKCRRCCCCLLLMANFLFLSGCGMQAKQVSAGIDYTCALTSSGGLKCWGNNQYGQLGNGTTSDPSTPEAKPVDVTGLRDATAISAGFHHTCALTISGNVKCWGDNSYGQLGNGTVDKHSTTPVDVAELREVTAISAGSDHTCAVTSTGAVLCWGRNDDAQLGNGTTNNSSVPVEVSGLTGGFSAVSAGVSHTCAIATSGAVKCWGLNNGGQLGNGTSTGTQTCGSSPCSTIPVDVTGLWEVTAISAGFHHTCALISSGEVKCWGWNDEGQLGNGTSGVRAFSDIPVDVTGLRDISAISAGGAYTCALTSLRSVKCWGDNFFGQLGNGTTGDRSTTPTTTPVDVRELLNITAISAGSDHTCALTSSGGLKCWGANNFGQLGNGMSGNSIKSTTPVSVKGFR